ncbi:hypothetical protein SAMN05216326_1177 [Nitrosomonas marina]|uniref:Uncharacterized protein n=1 Tax=Nitrosomonas marina TaxID=917 RepID=A0A1I0CYM4_9PROT|nr:hypothetical protein SAMN05216326_1177 [Nitrosomonas marina]
MLVMENILKSGNIENCLIAKRACVQELIMLRCQKVIVARLLSTSGGAERILLDVCCKTFSQAITGLHNDARIMISTLRRKFFGSLNMTCQ